MLGISVIRRALDDQALWGKDTQDPGLSQVRSDIYEDAPESNCGGMFDFMRTKRGLHFKVVRYFTGRGVRRRIGPIWYADVAGPALS